MKIEYLTDDIVNNIVKLIDNKTIANLLLCCKELKQNFNSYGLLKKTLNRFYKNRLKNLFNENVDKKIYDLFSKNFEKFKYIKLDKSYIDENYGGIKENIGKNIFEKYNSDYICAIGMFSELYILLRIKRDPGSIINQNQPFPHLTQDNTYDYFYFNNVNNIENYCSYTAKDNIVHSKNYFIKNHTYNCGCGQIFTCTNNNVNNISNEVFTLLIQNGNDL